MSGHWINESPRGEEMPVAMEYPFSFGRWHWYLEDLPALYDVVVRPTGHPDVQEFPTAREPMLAPDGTAVLFAFLENPDGKLVATWDEGRWWTPEESAAWILMLTAPATYVMAEGMRQQQMPRWWRRRKENRKRRES